MNAPRTAESRSSPRRRLNLRLLLGLLAVTALLAGGVHVVHGFQEVRNAGALLRRAEVAEKKGDLEENEKYLNRYLVSRPDDVSALAKYGLNFGVFRYAGMALAGAVAVLALMVILGLPVRWVLGPVTWPVRAVLGEKNAAKTA